MSGVIGFTGLLGGAQEITQNDWSGSFETRTGRIAVPQTDSGFRVEDTKAFERRMVKELGKITP